MAIATKYERVDELMILHAMSLVEIADCTGVDSRVIEAIACHRYTPSPEQRVQISRALSVDRDLVVWGHKALVDEYLHQPV